jgi:hypothetical protein
VVVVNGQVTGDINFSLQVVRADLICKAKDTYNNILNDINLEATGPEGLVSGYIANDSLVFECLPYGLYNGVAWMDESPDSVYSSIEMSEIKHEMVFVFDLTGINDRPEELSGTMQVYPNPFSGNTSVSFKLDEPAEISLKIFSQQGQLIRTLFDGRLESGVHQIAWNGEGEPGRAVTPGIYTAVLQTKSGRQAMVVIRIR